MTAGRPDRVLVAAGDPADLRLLEDVLEASGDIHVLGISRARDVPTLCETAAPDAVLLDLERADEALAALARLEPWTRAAPPVPVLAFGADVPREVERRALAAGARDVMAKPLDPDAVRLRVGRALEDRRVRRRLRDLETDLRQRTAELEGARLEILERLALAAEYRDDETREHTDRVGRTAALLAGLLGLPPAEVEALRQAAPLHDIGKIAISDSILLKPGRLTPDEYELMKTHAVIGASILEGSASAVLEMSAAVAVSHHERWDGTGYPSGLAGDAIPIVGRITAVADVFDALSHKRPFKRAWPVEEAVAEIHRQSGAHFDPDVVAAFARLDPVALVSPVTDGPPATR